MAECEIKVFRLERDFLILAGGMPDGLKMAAGCGMMQSKKVTGIGGRHAKNCNSNDGAIEPKIVKGD